MKEAKQIKEMLQLQQRLNDDTNGIGWENGTTKEGKLINWKRCIYMECAELVDSFPWKHWKNIKSPINKENVVVEIVDIWHFVMSLGLEIAAHDQKSIDELTLEIVSSSGFINFCKEPFKMEDYNAYEIVNDIEILINTCSGFNIDFLELLRNYFGLALKCEVNLKKLFSVYMGKNVLNKFRQDHGYKDGSYIKNWNGKEDNEIMNEILAKNINEPDKIYLELEKYYKSVK